MFKARWADMGSVVLVSTMPYMNESTTAPVRLHDQEAKKSTATTDDRSPVKKPFEVQRFRRGEALFVAVMHY